MYVSKLFFDLSSLATPDAGPWHNRKTPESNDDPRGRFQRDRDRILHSDSFRKLQYKTQVFVVHEGDFFRTRLTHSLEVAQIGRTLATLFGLSEPLVEAICLAHDLGHGPFGHTSEETINGYLQANGRAWNANANSLAVVSESEVQYFGCCGLNLTWATCEGIARHATNFDKPVEEGEYNAYAQPSLEAQAANVADLIAYCSHDVEDAVFAKMIDRSALDALNIEVWETCFRKAEDESKGASAWKEDEKSRLMTKRVHRHMIDFLIRDVVESTKAAMHHCSAGSIDDMRSMVSPLIMFSGGVRSDIDKLLQFMLDHVYKSTVVYRQNYRANFIIARLLGAFDSETKLLPKSVQDRILLGYDQKTEVARYVASLTDKSATDIFAELFQPYERSMGHFTE